MPDPKLKRRLRTGYLVFAGLAAIKIVEYLLAIVMPTGNWPILAAFAMISAGLIAYYYKHIRQLWDSKDRDNE